MINRDSIRQKRSAILEIGRRYGASDIRIFGSVARGDAVETSDLDLLVRLEPGRSLLDQGGLLMDLRDLLGMKVDVIDEEALSGRFGDIVRREAIPMRSDALRLQDILDAIRVIEQYLPADGGAFDRDPPLQSHIYRHLMIVREAA